MFLFRRPVWVSERFRYHLLEQSPMGVWNSGSHVGRQHILLGAFVRARMDSDVFAIEIISPKALASLLPSKSIHGKIGIALLA